MKTPADNTASLFKSHLLERIGEDKFEMWFGQIGMDFDGDELLLSVPNAFVEKMVRRTHLSLLKDVSESTFGREFNVRFALPQAAAAPARRPKAPAVMTRPVVVEDSPATPPRCSLDDFIVGEKNRMAFRAAKAFVSTEGGLYNPLFFYGSYGLGKTLLLRAVVSECKAANPSKRCLYISAEDFTNQYVSCTRRKEMHTFRNKFRNVDVLAIDDIHFLANKKGTQEEFLNTFNSIDIANKKIVLASDSHPTMIEELTDSLVSRFVSGMVVKMEMPEYETRRKIAIARAYSLGFKMSEDVADYIARTITTSVRELEGAVKKLSAQKVLLGEDVSISSAQYLLSDQVTRSCCRISTDDVVSAAATYFGVPMREMRSDSRTRSVSLARSVAMFLLREKTDLSFPEIGKIFGGKNHATAIQACKRITKCISDDATVSWKHNGIRRTEKIRPILKQLTESVSM
ncbi:MAG: chromosomal replication initiator protein DnaA [Phycisphaerae bacterium]